MSKLGIIVTRASAGLQELYSRNREGWEKYTASDIRARLGAIKGFSEGTGIVTFMRFVQPGAAFTVCKSIPGRGGDFTSATLFVPSGCDVTGRRLAGIIAALEDCIRAPYLDTASLEELFARDYPDKPFPSPILSAGTSSACRYYGDGTGHTLEELLDEPFQREYERFAGVFLIDKSSGLEASPSLADLTRKPLESMKGKVRISYRDFKVIDSATRGSLDGFRLFLNGVEVPAGSSATVPEQSAANVVVRVSCPGYLTYEKGRRISRPMEVMLVRREEPSRQSEAPKVQDRPSLTGLLLGRRALPFLSAFAGLVLGFFIGMWVYKPHDAAGQENPPVEEEGLVTGQPADSAALDSLAVEAAGVLPEEVVSEPSRPATRPSGRPRPGRADGRKPSSTVPPQETVQAPPQQETTED